MKRFISLLPLILAAVSAAQTVTVTINGTTYTGTLTAQATTPVSTAAPTLPKVMMTAAYPLNQPANTLPAETRSLNSSFNDPAGAFTPKPIATTFMAQFGANHVNFNTAMRITLVDTRQTPNVFAPVTMTQNWTASYDASHVPVVGCHIEGATTTTGNGPAGGDDHCIIYDAATGIDHELFGVTVANGVYSAAAYIPWDTTKAMVLPNGQTSADAAGLPVLPLLLRYAEAASGSINHALRVTMNLTRANGNGGVFTPPASHAAGQNWSTMAYEGQRLVLRADYPEAGLTPIELVIVHCLKIYGVVIADNGISGNIIADNDSHWGGGTNAANLPDLASMLLSDFIVVNSGPILDSTGAAAQ